MKHKHFIEVSNICPIITLTWFVHSKELKINCRTGSSVKCTEKKQQQTNKKYGMKICYLKSIPPATTIDPEIE